MHNLEAGNALCRVTLASEAFVDIAGASVQTGAAENTGAKSSDGSRRKTPLPCEIK